MKLDLTELTKVSPLIFDGAMGTMLQQAGLSGGVLPETYNITHPEIVTEIHRSYVLAGSEVVTANTFQSNRMNLANSGYGVDEVVSAALSCIKNAGARFAALDVGPLGELLEPVGELAFEEAVSIFAEQMAAGERHGANLIIIETFSDLYEMKAAILAAKENTSLPVIASLTFQQGGVTFMGCDAKTAAITLGALGADALGVNCSLGPADLIPIVDDLLKYSPVPVIVQANAGLPEIIKGKAVYAVEPREYAASVAALVKKGVRIVGGCCGTCPETISELRKAVSGISIPPAACLKYTAATTGSKTVFVNGETTVIGEGINPAARKDLTDAILTGDMETLAYEAVDEADADCELIDVNVSVAGADEAANMALAVKAIQSMTRLPLIIDSQLPRALEAGARVYNGRPVIRSVNGSENSMNAVFPIAKKYGALVIGNALDENGIPDTAEKRCEIAEKILDRALSYGISREDVLIDCLAFSAAASDNDLHM